MCIFFPKTVTLSKDANCPLGILAIFSRVDISLPNCRKIGNALLNKSSFGSSCLPIPSSSKIEMTVLMKSPSILTWCCLTAFNTSVSISDIFTFPRENVFRLTLSTICCILSAKVSLSITRWGVRERSTMSWPARYPSNSATARKSSRNFCRFFAFNVVIRPASMKTSSGR